MWVFVLIFAVIFAINHLLGEPLDAFIYEFIPRGWKGSVIVIVLLFGGFYWLDRIQRLEGEVRGLTAKLKRLQDRVER